MMNKMLRITLIGLNKNQLNNMNNFWKKKNKEELKQTMKENVFKL